MTFQDTYSYIAAIEATNREITTMTSAQEAEYPIVARFPFHDTHGDRAPKNIYMRIIRFALHIPI